MSNDNAKVYQGVRVKITVKELLRKRRARQAAECPTHAIQDASTPSYYKSNTQPQPSIDNYTSQRTESSTSYSCDFCFTHQMEAVASGEPCHFTLQHSWPFGKLSKQDVGNRPTCRSSFESSTSQYTLGEDIHPMETHRPSSFYPYTHYGPVHVDPTCGSHFTNAPPYETPVCGSNTQFSSSVSQDILEYPELFGPWYW